jgi:hypothetical protein
MMININTISEYKIPRFQITISPFIIVQYTTGLFQKLKFFLEIQKSFVVQESKELGGFVIKVIKYFFWIFLFIL